MQTIYDGNHNFSLLQQVKEACAGIDLSKRTAAVRDQLSEVASQFRVERTKLRRLAKTAEQIKSFDLALEGPGLTPPCELQMSLRCATSNPPAAAACAPIAARFAVLSCPDTR